ncbi:hypothetical protein GCM10020219_064240 [Nonomuraea dietziae]
MMRGRGVGHDRRGQDGHEHAHHQPGQRLEYLLLEVGPAGAAGDSGCALVVVMLPQFSLAVAVHGAVRPRDRRRAVRVEIGPASGEPVFKGPARTVRFSESRTRNGPGVSDGLVSGGPALRRAG